MNPFTFICVLHYVIRKVLNDSPVIVNPLILSFYLCAFVHEESLFFIGRSRLMFHFSVLDGVH